MPPASHLAAQAVEGAISAEIRSMATRAHIGGEFLGRVVVGGRTIEFPAFPLEGGRINVGTYYPVP